MTKLYSPVIHIIEDDLFYANALQKTISPTYENVSMFHSGEDVIDYKGPAPDVVFLDYWLGDVNGLTLMRKLIDLNPNVQIILISGQAKLDVVVQALRLGANEYLCKDDGLEGVLPALNKAAEISSLGKDLFKQRKIDKQSVPIFIGSFVLLVLVVAKMMYI